MSKATEITLDNGKKMPSIGLGTWKSAPGKVGSAVECAIDCGYRHIDCAWLYQNEDEIGDAIQKKINQGVVKREDIFLTSKLWNIFHNPVDVKVGVQESLTSLKLDYIDLYLMHSPIGYKNLKANELPSSSDVVVSKNSGRVIMPRDESNQSIVDETDYLDVWREMEKLVDEGLVKNIGISNFNIQQLERLYNEARIKPAVHQFELHPYLSQTKLLEYCVKKNITVTAYSPFASPDRPWKPKDELPLTCDPVIKEISTRINRSTHQIILRYLLQRKATVIPKSVTPRNIQSNLQVFDFELSEDDMEKILALNKNHRILSFSWDVNHKYYPFKTDNTEG